jgi:hypothetical protein
MLAVAGCAELGPQAPATTPAVPLPPSLQPGSVVIVNDPALLEQRIVRNAYPLVVEAARGSLPVDRSEAVKCVDVGATLQLVGDRKSVV